ncbi:pyruvate ferredoxin oxidoreductase subunit gamma [Candidatus Micrarchaeota archaeon]|nr:pyruvate ferredoxin oxidoreductase subunit gamma [Candidatus Micrarchaeota archaeon]
MIEIRIHGRGGQGAVTAAELLAIAVGFKGKSSQSFPYFGVERRGAPVQAYCRIDDKPIRVHQNVYTPDYIVVLDPTLIDSIDVCEGLKKEGTVIVNTHLSSEQCKKKLKSKQVGEVYTVDATSIALEKIGKPIVNTAMLGAFVNLVDWVDSQCLEKAVNEFFDDKNMADKNIAAFKGCCEIVKV